MHRFPTDSLVFRCHVAAVLFVIRCVVPLVGLPMLLWGMFVDDRGYLMWGLILTLAFPVMAVVHWIVAARVRCPLCFMPPLVNRSCVRNHKAKRLLGSYRLMVAYSVLFVGSFRCPYCGEHTVMKSRRR